MVHYMTTSLFYMGGLDHGVRLYALVLSMVALIGTLEVIYLAHRSASFLPWHRYTLMIFENALREHAGFTGQIP